MDKLIDLSDLTILMTVYVDSIERLENLLATSQFLVDHFQTNVWVEEYAPYCNGLLSSLLDKNIRYTFKADDDPIFYRTKYLNMMSRSIETKYVSVWDADVLFPVNQIVQSIESLRTGKVDFVYPYNRQFFDTSSILRKLFLQERNVELLERNVLKMNPMYLPCPIGGAFLAKHESYLNAGLENENFYGWGMEDNERYYRWKECGYSVEFVPGPLFHLSHGRGINSRYHNPDQVFIKNKEFSRVLRSITVDCSQRSDNLKLVQIVY